MAVTTAVFAWRLSLNTGDDVKVDEKTNPANHIEGATSTMRMWFVCVRVCVCARACVCAYVCVHPSTSIVPFASMHSAAQRNRHPFLTPCA